MTKQLLIILALASCFALHATAQTATSSNAPPSANTDDSRVEFASALPQSRLAGTTRLTVWGFQVYDAKLWTVPGATADKVASQAFALELTYLRAFDSMDIATRSITEMRRSAPVSEVQAKAWMDEMQRVIPNVKPGDRVMGIHRPGLGAQFWVNGKQSGEIRDVEFARLFFGIWLSPKTSEPKMRLALLAGVL